MKIVGLDSTKSRKGTGQLHTGSYHETLKIFLGNLSRLKFSDLTDAKSSFVIGLILSFVDGDLFFHGQCTRWIIFAEFSSYVRRLWYVFIVVVEMY